MIADDERRIPRRAVMLSLGAASVGALATATCHAPGGSAAQMKGSRKAMSSATKMPVAFLPHGGGPWPFVDMGLDRKEVDELASYLRSVNGLPKAPPKALLVVSAHWEAPVPTVMTSARPPMLYDYYGFPPASYEIQWPAPGMTVTPRRSFTTGFIIALRLSTV